MSAKRLPTCRHCGRRFKPCVFNRHHQQWCSLPECRGARDRERKRRYHLRRAASDSSYRESELVRCREAMRRIRTAGPDAGAAADAPVCSEVLSGLISQLVDSTDPEVVRQAAARYAERGRLLSVSCRVRGSPGV